MNANKPLVFLLAFSMSLNASQKVKESPAAASRLVSYFFVTQDAKLTPLDKIWFEESGFVMSKIAENSAAGISEKKAIKLPLDLAEIVEVNTLLLFIKNNQPDDLRSHIFHMIGIHENSRGASVSSELSEGQIIKKIEILKRFYKNIRTLDIKKLYPVFREAFILLLTYSEMLRAFTYKPALLGDLGLPADLLMDKGVQVLSQDDQEFLRSQLYEDIEIQGQPSHLRISPNGEYLLTASVSGKQGFISVLHVGHAKEFSRVELREPIEQLCWFGSSHIIIRTHSSIMMWDISNDTDITPSWWQDILKDVGTIWSVVSSKDLSKVALGADDKILLLNIGQRTFRALSAPAGDKKGGKKKNESKLAFVGEDKLLVEMRSSGDILFYSVDSGVCVSHEKGDGYEYEHHYINGDSLITISTGKEARIWDCQRDAQKRLLQKGNILNNSTVFVSFGQQIEVVPDQQLSIYDTASNKFIADMPFLTGTDVDDVVKLKKDGAFVLTTKNNVTLDLPIFDAPKQLCTSYDGSYLFAGSKNNIRLFHYFNAEVRNFLETGMTLAQGLCVKVMINWLKVTIESKKNTSYEHSVLRQPHLLEIFNGMDETFKVLVEHSFPEMCSPQEERMFSGATSSSSLYGEAQGSPSLGKKPKRKGRFFSLKRTASTPRSGENSPRSPRSPRLERRNTGPELSTITELTKSQRFQISLPGSPKIGTPKTGSPRIGSPRTGSPRTGSPVESPRRMIDDWEAGPAEGQQSPKSLRESADRPLARVNRTDIVASPLRSSNSDTRTLMAQGPSAVEVQDIAFIEDITTLKASELKAISPRSLGAVPENHADSVHGKESVLTRRSSGSKMSPLLAKAAARTSLRDVTSASTIVQASSSPRSGNSSPRKDSSRRVSFRETSTVSGEVKVESPRITELSTRTNSANPSSQESSATQSTSSPLMSPRSSTHEIVIVQAADNFSEVSVSSVEIETAEMVVVEELTDTLGVYRAGIEAFRNGQYDKAFINFNQLHKLAIDKSLKMLSAYWLGEMYLFGKGVPIDYTLARERFMTAAKQNVDLAIKALAYERLGEIYYFGQAVDPSDTKAHDYFKRALDTNEATPQAKIPALFLLRQMMKKMAGADIGPSKEYLDQVRSLCLVQTESNTQGEFAPLAFLIQGRLWLDEGATKSDFEKAAKCFTKVIESKADNSMKAEAYYRLGRLSYEHLDSRTKAKKYLEKAIEIGTNGWVTHSSYVHLGHIARDGNGSKKCSATREALDLYEKALHQTRNMYAKYEAAFHSARLYEKGDKDVAIDYAKVFLFDKDVSEQFYCDKLAIKAYYSLAIQYYDGNPIMELNLPEAMKCYKCIDVGCLDISMLEEAWYRIAEMYRDGIAGIKKSTAQSNEYYRKIHEKGKNQKYLHIALCRLGEDALRRRDLKEAEAFLHSARTLDINPEAQREAKVLYAQLEVKKAQKGEDVEG